MVSHTECTMTYNQAVIWPYCYVFHGQGEAAKSNLQRNFSIDDSLIIDNNLRVATSK